MKIKEFFKLTKGKVILTIMLSILWTIYKMFEGLALWDACHTIYCKYIGWKSGLEAIIGLLVYFIINLIVIYIIICILYYLKDKNKSKNKKRK